MESQFDPTKIKRAEVVLKELLAEHGHQFATVKPTYERIPATNAVKLIFNIDEGPKVKVGEITFVGNKAFSSAKAHPLHATRPAVSRFLWTSPTFRCWRKTFDRPKLDEDLEVGIRGLYQDNGYFKVVVKDPILKTVDEDRGGIPGPLPVIGTKHGKATNITIPSKKASSTAWASSVPQRRSGAGLVFKPEYLAEVFPLKEGDIFAADKIRKAIDNYKKLYGEYGYIDFTAEPQLRRGRCEKDRRPDVRLRPAESNSSCGASNFPATPPRATKSSAANC